MKKNNNNEPFPLGYPSHHTCLYTGQETLCKWQDGSAEGKEQILFEKVESGKFRADDLKVVCHGGHSGV